MSDRIPLSAPDITSAEIDAVTAVLRTGRLSLGPEMERFEEALSLYHGVPEAVAVNSGTAGLHLALLTLGIGTDDEVILPSFAFLAVANALLQVGATPVFAEIDPITLNLDPVAVQAAITSRTRAILVVHTFGVPAAMDELQAIARRHSLFLIEDACEGIGATYGDLHDAQPVGSFGDLAVLGFYPNKQITTGEGGAILVRDPAHGERLRRLRNQGRAANAGWLDQVELGYNYRLSELACALGRVQLGRIAEILALRRTAALRYEALLGGIAGLELPPLGLPRRTISWFVYVVRLPERDSTESDFRDRVRSALADSGIESGRYFPPIHLQPAWCNRLARPISVPLTESVARRTLALPFFNRISEGQQQRVAEAIFDALAKCKRL